MEGCEGTGRTRQIFTPSVHSQPALDVLMSDGVLNHRDLCALDIFLLVIPGKQTLSGLTLL